MNTPVGVNEPFYNGVKQAIQNSSRFTMTWTRGQAWEGK